MNKRHSRRNSGRRSTPAAIAGLPVAKNDEAVIDIIGMNHDGEGLAEQKATPCSSRVPFPARRSA